MKPALATFTSLAGSVVIGFKRSDIRIVHVIAQGPPGSRFQVAEHFRDCEICMEHGIDEALFAEYMRSLPPRLSGGTPS